jgi:hypothetical protein
VEFLGIYVSISLVCLVLAVPLVFYIDDGSEPKTKVVRVKHIIGIAFIVMFLGWFVLFMAGWEALAKLFTDGRVGKFLNMPLGKEKE